MKSLLTDKDNPYKNTNKNNEYPNYQRNDIFKKNTVSIIDSDEDEDKKALLLKRKKKQLIKNKYDFII